MTTSKHRFFVSPDLITADRIVFPLDEARHASKVLRLAQGNDVTVVDGVGWTYNAVLEAISPKGAVARILAKNYGVGESSASVHIAVGVLKQAARWEIFLEKAVELGATRITPLLTERTQKIGFNQRRAEAIVIAALKQSGRSRLPILDIPTPLDSVLTSGADAMVKMVCHEASTQAPRLSACMTSKPDSVSVLIGPEGGFSDEEMSRVEAKGWTVVWLGERRLRTETAAMLALGLVTQALQEKG